MPAPGWTAPQTAAAPRGSAKALALSRRYMQAVDMQKQVDVILQTLLPQMLAAQGDGLTPEQRNVISQATRESMAALYPKILDQAANEYAILYTEDELQALVDFYEAPLGRSITQKAPKAAPAMSAAMAKLLPDLQADILARVCAKVDCSANGATKKTPA
jgi:hypothetical protein